MDVVKLINDLLDQGKSREEIKNIVLEKLNVGMASIDGQGISNHRSTVSQSGQDSGQRQGAKDKELQNGETA